MAGLGGIGDGAELHLGGGINLVHHLWRRQGTVQRISDTLGTVGRD